jgi:predicted alpha/beta superfamily hydrolase
MIEAMPPTVVVGIANVDRKRDFTFPTTVAKDKQDFPTTGQSAAFIQFLQTELVPYINSQYRTNGNTTLIGQSLGGLLATEILLKNEQLFSNYVIVSPSLWWNRQSLLTMLKKHTIQSHHKIYIAVGGKEHKVMRKDAKELKAILEKEMIKRSALKFEKMAKESHLTILHNAAYNALVWLYTDNKTQKK